MVRTEMASADIRKAKDILEYQFVRLLLVVVERS
jgi:hypothetical protein